LGNWRERVPHKKRGRRASPQTRSSFARGCPAGKEKRSPKKTKSASCERGRDQRNLSFICPKEQLLAKEGKNGNFQRKRLGK